MFIKESARILALNFTPGQSQKRLRIKGFLKSSGAAMEVAKILIPLVSALAFVQPSLAADYYVSASGSDNNPGTEALPFRNPQAAANVVNPGDTVYIMNGTYAAPSGTKRVMNLNRSGTAGNMITFRNYPGHSPQIGRLPASRAEDFGFAFGNGASHIRVEGLKFAGTRFSCLWLSNLEPAENIEVIGNIFDQCGKAEANCTDTFGRAAIFTGRLHNGTLIEGNVFSNTGRVYDASCDANHSQADNHQYRHDQALYLKGQGHVIRNNVFYENNMGYGIKVDGSALSPVVPPAFSHVIVNNTFGPNNSRQPYDGRSGNPVVIFRNGENKTWPRYLIANNLFIEPSIGGLDKSAVMIHTGLGSATNPPTDNVCRNNVTTGTTAIATCAEYSAAHLTNILVSDNLLGQTDAQIDMYDVAQHDYRLGPSSSAIGHAYASVAPADDFEGNPRDIANDSVDAGAYEFIPRTRPNPPQLIASDN